ncbi:hypothetical protein MTO96_028082 [Rhipicephalus appendiculatus]
MDADEQSSADASEDDSSVSDTAKKEGNKPLSILKFGKGQRRRGRRRSIRWHGVDAENGGSPQTNEAAAGSNVPVVPLAAALPPTQHATPVSSTMPQVGTPAQVPPATATPAALASRYPPFVTVEPTVTLASTPSAVPPSRPAAAASFLRLSAPTPAVNPAVPLYGGVIPAPDNAIGQSRAQNVPPVQSVPAAASSHCLSGFPVVAIVLLAVAFATVGLITFLAFFIEVWPEETDTVDGSVELTELTDFEVPSANEYTNTLPTTPVKTPTSDENGIPRVGGDRTEGDEQNEFSTIGLETPLSESPTPV